MIGKSHKLAMAPRPVASAAILLRIVRVHPVARIGWEDDGW